MKINIVYLRTMENSPKVRIIGATASNEMAHLLFKKAKAEETEWMATEEKDSGNWAEACMMSYEMADKRKPGDKVYFVVETLWVEYVRTIVTPFLYEINAKTYVDDQKRAYMEEFPGLEPFRENETILESMHLEDPGIMADVYFSIESVSLV